MPSVPAPAVPAELRGVKRMTKLKGLVVENSLTGLCPVPGVTSYPGLKVRFIQVGNLYLLLTATSIRWKVSAQGARRFSKAN